MASAQPTLQSLSKQVAELSASLQNALEKQGHKQPSLGLDGLLAYPFEPEIIGIKDQLTQAMDDLKQLVCLPQERFGTLILAEIHDITALKVYNQLNFWDAVPLEHSTTVDELAKKVNLPAEIVGRLIRHTSGSHIFNLTPDGVTVSHSPASAAFVRDRALRAWIGHHVDETWPSSVNITDALRYYKANATDPEKTAASYTFFRDDPSTKTIFEFYNRPEEKWRVARFGQAMAWATATPAFDFSHMLAMYDWRALGEFTFVDIGGSTGHISFQMAATCEQGKFVVEDLPELQQSFDAAKPAALGERVTFRAHDFFTPQPVQGADVYFLKHILHDWSDPYAAKIIKQVVPAMQSNPRARLIFMEGVIPPREAVPRELFRTLTGLDMHMLAMCNSKERTVDQWKQLLELAHPDLEFLGVHQRPGSAFVLIESALKSAKRS